ncbi:hypothetical protein [Pedobacter montanisoli]|uniref:Uncharacterized protein n=1 Tax=Pedobacter montanisoli TaxID=2923277 RepID=A0ABS9ZRS4_9SPHI|nr:hypothetical protein [Pedobacter montanisoli]MCJ0741072.1 hypothetical protein [Pedobacter montanisoli]
MISFAAHPEKSWITRLEMITNFTTYNMHKTSKMMAYCCMMMPLAYQCIG